MVKSHIETYLRIKPNNEDNQNESLFNIKNQNLLEITLPEETKKNFGYVNNIRRTYDFKFTGIYDQTKPQQIIFQGIGEKVIRNSLEGYNNTVFCYGQTGSGKTYTMCGSKNWNERGLIPRILVDLFSQVRKMKNYIYDIYISYLEIYNENAYDLLDRQHSEIELENWRKIIVYEDNIGNIILKNLSLVKVDNEREALNLLINGNYIRHVSSTPMNMASSRSHAIFSIVLEGREISSEIMRTSKINLVDLAGSERMRANQYDQSLINETKYINLSLTFLEQVIIALAEKNQGTRSHIPYRNSLMTTILKDSLGGNCKTILIANVSSDHEQLDETISTARFAARCAKVENEIHMNEHMDLNVLVNKLQADNMILKQKLEKYETIDLSNLEALNKKELSQYEKDECKILISEYLNDSSKDKKINARNASQLYYIIDFLIEYINNKEKFYKDKMQETYQQYRELSENFDIYYTSLVKIRKIINQKNINTHFNSIFIDEIIENTKIKNKEIKSKSTRVNNYDLNIFSSKNDDDNEESENKIYSTIINNNKNRINEHGQYSKNPEKIIKNEQTNVVDRNEFKIKDREAKEINELDLLKAEKKDYIRSLPKLKQFKDNSNIK